ncbi:MAG: serine hydrolase [Candidatus Paceibacterota bacterium]
MSSRRYLTILGTVAGALVFAAAFLRFSLPPTVASDSMSVGQNATVADADPSFFDWSRLDGDVATSTKTDSLSSIEDVIIGSISNLPRKPPVKKLGVTARAYLIGNIASGKVFLSTNANVSLPVASMSKLVTALIVLYSLPATSTIEITQEIMDKLPAENNFTAGDKYTAKELLYPMLLTSSNIAAEALASATNRAKFLELMSGYAWEIGMPETYFADPSGISPQNTASANNIFALARYLYNFHPDVLAMTRVSQMLVPATAEHIERIFPSIHPFVDDPRFIGGKTGRTPQAKETMLTMLNINDQPIAFVVMGSEVGMREADTRTLISEYLRIQANL